VKARFPENAVKPLRDRTTLGRLPGEGVWEALERIAKEQGYRIGGGGPRAMPGTIREGRWGRAVDLGPDDDNHESEG
jgi:hypothetical protein